MFIFQLAMQQRFQVFTIIVGECQCHLCINLCIQEGISKSRQNQMLPLKKMIFMINNTTTCALPINFIYTYNIARTFLL